MDIFANKNNIKIVLAIRNYNMGVLNAINPHIFIKILEINFLRAC